MSAGGWSHPAYEAISRLFSESTGLVIPVNRYGFAEAAIRRAMAKARVLAADDYLSRLRSAKLSLDDLTDELTVGETYFFRDPAHFDFIRQEVLPGLLRRCGSQHLVRAWSAGCASGEEAYSLAILFEQEGLASQSRVLATDISRAALAKARAGVYGAWSLRNQTCDLAHIYFRRRGDRFHLTEKLRSRVTFEQLNLVSAVYPGHLAGGPAVDLILCRNVFIYLSRDTISHIARRLFDILADGGWLITGPSDPLLSDYAPYDVSVTSSGVFYRKGVRPSARSLEWPATPNLCPSEFRLDCAEERVRELPLAAPLPPSIDLIDQARHAYRQGNYAAVVALTGDLRDDLAACELRIRSLANLGQLTEAEAAATAAVACDALSAERHLLHAVVLMERGRYEDAARAVRSAIYLDRTLAVAYIMLGSILLRIGDVREASRAYQNCYKLAAGRPPNEIAPHSGGESAGRLAEAAKAHVELIPAAAAGVQ